MRFFVIKHTDENKFVQFKAHSPYWTDDRFKAAAYETAIDAEIAMRRYGIPYCTPVVREPLRKDTNVPSDFYATGRDCPLL